MNKRWSRRTLVLLVAVTAVVFVGCGGGSDSGNANEGGGGSDEAASAPIPTLTITTEDFKFSTDQPSVPAGWVQVDQVNKGKEPHEVQIFKLNEGVTFDQFAKDQGGPGIAKLAVPAGGTSGSAGINPGETESVTLNLEEGHYALICFVHGHNQKGMYAPFEVTAAEGGEQQVPDTVGEIKTADFEIFLPDGFDGQGTYAVTNEGPSDHEVTFFKVDATLDELDKYLASDKAFHGPPPGGNQGITNSGGVAALHPGGTQYVTLDLDPGVYVAACFVPGKDGQPHAYMGMFKSFEVK